MIVLPFISLTDTCVLSIFTLLNLAYLKGIKGQLIIYCTIHSICMLLLFSNKGVVPWM